MIEKLGTAKYFFSPLIDFIVASLKTLGYSLGIFLFSYLELPREALGLLLLISFFDILTGIFKTASIKWWQVVTSNKFTLGVIKKVLIFSAILIFSAALKANDISWADMLKKIVWVFAIWEAYSAIGNCYSWYSKKELPEFDAISFILKWISSTLQKILESILQRPTK